MHEAIENADYEAWQELMQTRITKMQESINEDNFNLIVERYDSMSQVHELREELRQALEDGDDETAEELKIKLQELMPEDAGNGFRNHNERAKGMGMKMRMHNKMPLA